MPVLNYVFSYSQKNNEYLVVIKLINQLFIVFVLSKGKIVLKSYNQKVNQLLIALHMQKQNFSRSQLFC